jgi:omega-amidase
MALLTARAIENQSYVIGVNRVGLDGNGHAYAGDSMVLDPQGKILFQAQDKEVLHTADLDAASQEAYRESFPAWRDADPWPSGASPQ